MEERVLPLAPVRTYFPAAFRGEDFENGFGAVPGAGILVGIEEEASFLQLSAGRQEALPGKLLPELRPLEAQKFGSARGKFPGGDVPFRPRAMRPRGEFFRRLRGGAQAVAAEDDGFGEARSVPGGFGRHGGEKDSQQGKSRHEKTTHSSSFLRKAVMRRFDIQRFSGNQMPREGSRRSSTSGKKSISSLCSSET